MKARDWKAKFKKACIENGTFQDCFDTSLKILSELMEKRDDALEFYEELGNRTMIYDEDNKLIRNPALSILNDCEKNALPYLRDLGLTPAGLKKIDSDKTQKLVKKDAFDELVDEIIS